MLRRAFILLDRPTSHSAAASGLILLVIHSVPSFVQRRPTLGSIFVTLYHKYHTLCRVTILRVILVPGFPHLRCLLALTQMWQ